MKPPVSEQIRIVEEYIAKNPDFARLLERHKKGLELRKEIEDMQSKGLDLDIPAAMKDLSEQALADGKPIAMLLDPTNFSTPELKVYLKKLLTGFEEFEARGSKQYVQALKDEKLSVNELVGAALKDDIEKIAGLSKRHGIDMGLMYSTSNALIQPSMEELARTVPQELIESWNKAKCPVCGREASFGTIKDKKRYFKCNLCGCEYQVGLFLCNHCGNTDPKTLMFLAVGEKLDSRIDFCKLCNHYVKIIELDKVKERLPDGLEDLLTLELDFIAKNEGLVKPI